MNESFRSFAYVLGLLTPMLTAALLTSCNYSIKKAPPVDGLEVAGKLNAPLTFAIVMEKVIAPRCLECHSQTHGNKGDINLETYSEVRQMIPEIKADILDGSMPKKRSPLTTEQKSILLSWIAQGFPETEKSAPQKPAREIPAGTVSGTSPGVPSSSTSLPTSTSTASEPEVLDFRTVFTKVIQPACVKCHSAKDHDNDVVLDTYSDVFKHRMEIEKEVRDGSMPKKKALDLAQRDLLLRWLRAGAAEEPRVSQPLPIETPEYDPTNPAIGAPVRSTEDLATLQRGQYIYRAGLCVNCHTTDTEKPLAGGLKIESPFGTFYTPNITPDRNTGIGSWTRADFLRAMKHGVSPSAEYYYPSFPYQNYAKLSDADLLDLRAYLMAMKPISQVNKAHILSFPYNQRALLGPWRLLNFPTVFGRNEENFRVARGTFEPIKGKSAEWNRGAYLIEGAFHCTQCHTPRGSLGGFKMDEWMSGSSLSGEKRAASNLTPDLATGLEWSEAGWIRFLQTGTTPGGSNVGGEMRKIVLHGTAKLTAADQRAIAIYLRELRPVRNIKIKNLDSK